MIEFQYKLFDDFHTHPREDDELPIIIPGLNIYGRVTAMGNLKKSVDSVKRLKNWQAQVDTTKPKCKPIYAVMLTKRMTPDVLRDCFNAGARVLKWIPDGASTNSSGGYSLFEILNLREIFDEAKRLGMIVSVHFELPTELDGTPITESMREMRAIPFLIQLNELFPGMKIIVEHVTTEAMINVVLSLPENVAATNTPQHMILTEEWIFDAGRIAFSKHYSKPVAKTRRDRRALVNAATSGNPKFFFGTDTAYHHWRSKDKKPPSAGIYIPGEVAIPALMMVFDKRDKLAELEDFGSRFGAEFYGLPLNESTFQVARQNWTVPKTHGDSYVFLGGRKLPWKVEHPHTIF